MAMSVTRTPAPPNPTLDKFTAAVHAHGRHTLGPWLITCGWGGPRYPARYIRVEDTTTEITATGPHWSETSLRPLAHAYVLPDDGSIAALYDAAVAAMAAPLCGECHGLTTIVQYCSCRYGCAMCEGYNPMRIPCRDCRS